MQENMSLKGRRIALKLNKTIQRCDKLLRAKEWSILSRRHIKTTSCPLRAGIDGYTPNIEPFSVSHPLCEQVEYFRVSQVHSLYDKHQQTHLICQEHCYSGCFILFSSLNHLLLPYVIHYFLFMFYIFII